MKPYSPDPSKTVLVITAGLLVVYWFTGWIWALNSALVIGIAGVLSDYLAGKINFIWMQLVRVLSLIVPNIILMLIFYLFLFPLAMLARLFRKTPPVILKNPDHSMFTGNGKSFDKAHFEKPW